MTCIQKLLEMKGDTEFLPINSRAALERGGNYKGYDWCVTLTESGTRCGYVAIDRDNKLYGKSYSEYDDLIFCHGGVTFHDSPNKILDKEMVGESICGDEWIGFDSAHAYDGRDTELAMKALPDSEKAKEIHNFYKNNNDVFTDSVLRSADYMEENCKAIIDKIIKE